MYLRERNRRGARKRRTPRCGSFFARESEYFRTRARRPYLAALVHESMPHFQRDLLKSERSPSCYSYLNRVSESRSRSFTSSMMRRNSRRFKTFYSFEQTLLIAESFLTHRIRNLSSSFFNLILSSSSDRHP